MRPEIKFMLREDAFHALVNTNIIQTIHNTTTTTTTTANNPPATSTILTQYQENHFLDTADSGRGNLAARHTILRIRLHRKITDTTTTTSPVPPPEDEEQLQPQIPVIATAVATAGKAEDHVHDAGFEEDEEEWSPTVVPVDAQCWGDQCTATTNGGGSPWRLRTVTLFVLVQRVAALRRVSVEVETCGASWRSLINMTVRWRNPIHHSEGLPVPPPKQQQEQQPVLEPMEGTNRC